MKIARVWINATIRCEWFCKHALIFFFFFFWNVSSLFQYSLCNTICLYMFKDCCQYKINGNVEQNCIWIDNCKISYIAFTSPDNCSNPEDIQGNAIKQSGESHHVISFLYGLYIALPIMGSYLSILIKKSFHSKRMRINNTNFIASEVIPT